MTTPSHIILQLYEILSYHTHLRYACTSTHNIGNFFEHPSSEGRKSRAGKKHWKVFHIPSDFPLGSEQQQTENWVGILIALTHDT